MIFTKPVKILCFFQKIVVFFEKTCIILLLEKEREVHTMKKRIMALLLTALTIVSLTACGEPFTCDICGEEKTGKKYSETILGEEITYCHDCYKEIKEFINSFN